MRNLALSNFDSFCFQELQNCQLFCNDRNRLFIYGEGIVVQCNVKEEKVLCNLTENIFPVTDINSIPKALDITYCCEKELLYLILINGDIVSLNTDKYGSETIIGTVDDGIKAAKWSPDQEVIALITGNDSVIVMSNDFDPVAEVSLHEDGFGEKQFIAVGWGKKETQFRGSEGKLNKKEQVDFAFENSSSIKISWRGDAEYFVVSCMNPKTLLRYLRIFNKSGVLQFTSENFQGLEDCLDWRPSGNLIASTRKLPNKYIVCFLEKNGLMHGEFALRFSYDKIKVEELLWNADSKILALLISNVSDNSETLNKRKYIELFTMSNYHWYCKYTITFDSDLEPLILKWDSYKYNTLHIMVKKGKYLFHYLYSWLWVTNKSKSKSGKDESFVAVIDGCDLLLTSFKKGITPPPLYTYKLQTLLPINSVSFGPDDDNTSSNDLIVMLSDHSLLFYKFVEDEFQTIKHELIGKISDICKKSDVIYNVKWVASRTIMFSLIKTMEVERKFFINKIDFKSIKLISNYEKIEIPTMSSIATLRAAKSGVALNNNDGQILFFDYDKNEIYPLFPKENKVFLDFEVIDKEDGSFLILGLDNLNKFYINNKLILNNVLSFHIHGIFVLLTTMKHELLCWNYENEIHNIEKMAELCKRKVERGSRIITSVHKDLKVILQMPRGNLECLQPRALSIFILSKYLNNLNYYEAFDLMRKQRINLNLLYDHDPDLFCKNLNVFFNQIKDIQWISLFLSELSEEDVTQTMYSFFYGSENLHKNVNENKSKINHICDLTEKTLSKKENAEEYFLPILTCYIKRGSTEFLETVLLKMKFLKEKESKGVKSVVTFEEAFKYVLYLVDVEDLYKTALGMYDFDLVMMVAAKSQKDPKEYISFLNDLKTMEPNYQKFKIDKHLKRYPKALSNLVLCDDENSFNECLNFIKTHQLFKLALKLIPQNTDRYKNVCMCYAEELMKCHLYEEAGIMYCNAGMLKNAIDAYRKSGNWHEVIFCGKELNLNESEINELYLDLALELNETKQFKEAACVYLDYLHDVEECVKTLCKGKFFAEAYRISYLHHFSDLINFVILPAIVEQSDLTKLQMVNFKETFLRQKARLLLVRKMKQETFESKMDFDDEELFSESNTIISQSNASSRTTNRTYRSAKNRRKQERKLFSLKEGSPYEDLALITSLHNIVTNCYEMKYEVNNLVKFLVKIRNYEMAESLQNEFEKLLKLIDSSKSEIWNFDLRNNRQYYGPEATSNEIAAMYMKSGNSAPVQLNTKFATPPEPENNVKWELEILKS